MRANEVVPRRVERRGLEVKFALLGERNRQARHALLLLAQRQVRALDVRRADVRFFRIPHDRELLHRRHFLRTVAPRGRTPALIVAVAERLENLAEVATVPLERRFDRVQVPRQGVRRKLRAVSTLE